MNRCICTLKYTLISFLLYLPNLYSAPVPIDDLFNSADMSLIQFSPNGKFLSAHMKELDNHYVSIFNIETGELHKGIELRNSMLLKSYQWLTNDLLFVSTEATFGVRHYLIEIVTKNAQITFVEYSITDEGQLLDTLKDDPKHILFVSKNYGFRKDAYALLKLSISDIKRKRVAKAKQIEGPSKKGYFHYQFDAMSNRIIASRFNKDDQAFDYFYKGLNKRSWKPLLRVSKNFDRFSIVGFIDETQLAVLSSKNTDRTSLQVFDIDKQRLTDVLYSHSKYDLLGAKLSSKDGSLVSVSYLDHGQYTEQFFSKQDEKENAVLKRAFDVDHVATVAAHQQQKMKVIIAFSSNDGGTYYLYYQDKKSAELLAARNSRLNDYSFAKTQLLSAKAADGTEIQAYYTPPSEKSHNVLLVMPHGGPIGVNDTDFFTPQLHYLSSRGFSILRVNFRGSSGYGESFQNKGRGQFGQAIEEDITSVLNTLLKTNKYKHICSMGSSYGGYSAMMLAVKHPETYDCVISSYGIFDLRLLFSGSNITATEEFNRSIERIVGKNSESLVDQSPVYLADKIQSPVLLIGGKKDRVAIIEHSYRMKLMLKAFNKPFESVFYKNVGHGQKTWWGDQHENVYIVDFLHRTLKLDKLYWPETLGAREHSGMLREQKILFETYSDADRIETERYYKKIN